MIKVLIIDDSAFVCKVLTEELSKFEDIKVLGSAIDPYVARDKIVKLQPDVITLDLEMPKMDGLSFLSKLMKYYPIPVIIVSSLTLENSNSIIRALEIGAIDVVNKPSGRFSIPEVNSKLIQAIRTASHAKIVRKFMESNTGQVSITNNSDLETKYKIIAMGSSTGGIQALESVLRLMPSTSPGTLIVQHMPEGFTVSFAERLNSISSMEVREAKDGDPVIPGVAMIAPGNKHMVLSKNGNTFFVSVKDGLPVHFQRPSVDVLFNSVALNAGVNAIGIILTGMGRDGAKGLLSMKTAGSYTIAQDEESCIVYGMPGEAVKLKAVDEIVSLDNIPNAILKRLRKTIK